MAEEPAIKYAMAFIDGQNVYQHAKDAFGHHHPNYDPLKLHSAVCARHNWTPTLVRFYTGIPNAAESPMWAGYWAKRILFMKRAGVHVTTRPLRYRKERVVDASGRETIITTPQEKGVDVRLALDVISTARTKQWDVAVIFSQDQDLPRSCKRFAKSRKNRIDGRKFAARSRPARTQRRAVASTGQRGSKWIGPSMTLALIQPTTARSDSFTPGRDHRVAPP